MARLLLGAAAVVAALLVPASAFASHNFGTQGNFNDSYTGGRSSIRAPGYNFINKPDGWSIMRVDAETQVSGAAGLIQVGFGNTSSSQTFSRCPNPHTQLTNFAEVVQRGAMSASFCQWYSQIGTLQTDFKYSVIRIPNGGYWDVFIDGVLQSQVFTGFNATVGGGVKVGGELFSASVFPDAGLLADACFGCVSGDTKWQWTTDYQGGTVNWHTISLSTPQYNSSRWYVNGNNCGCMSLGSPIDIQHNQ